MPHPYARKEIEADISIDIAVEVLGEYQDGLPHGLCFMFYKYSNEFGPKPLSFYNTQDPYIDGEAFSFKGVGNFLEGVLNDGPALFIKGNGEICSFSWV